MFFIIVISLLFHVSIEASIVLDYNDQHLNVNSLPALFGMKFTDGIQYKAHLQVPLDDPYLCVNSDREYGGEGTLMKHYNDRHSGEISNGLIAESVHVERNAGVVSFDDTIDNDIFMPNDNIPVALLVKRGMCSFEQKARVAQTLKPLGTVKYLVVYDNNEHSILMPMAADNPNGITIGLVLITFHSGSALLKEVNSESSNVGPVISINGESQLYQHIFGYPQELITAALAGLLIFFFCFGCAFASIQTGFLTIEGNFVIFGRGINFDGNGLVINGRNQHRLPTLEQIQSLPEVVYRKKDISPDANPRETDDLKDNNTNFGLINTPLEYDESTNNQCPIENEELNNNTSSSGTSITIVQEQESKSKELDENLSCYFDNNICSVCLDEYESGDKMTILPCKHSFHTECIVKWLTERQPTCPLCKTVVVFNDDSSSSSHGSVTDEHHQIFDNDTHRGNWIFSFLRRRNDNDDAIHEAQEQT